MQEFFLNNLKATIDFEKGCVTSLIIEKNECLVSHLPLFKIRIRDKKGNPTVFDTFDAANAKKVENGAVYSDFKKAKDISILVKATVCNDELQWKISVDNSDKSILVEWVDFPLIELPKLIDNNECNNGGKILIPYNEGAIITDADCREEGVLCYQEPEYPSIGCYYIFPNMISSQMIAYLWDSIGLYVGAHDTKRGIKGIDFCKTKNGIAIQIRLFCGVNYGESYTSDFPVVWKAIDGNWESAAETYRNWFEENLPSKVTKIKSNHALPEWYEDSPLIVSYPVRGRYDTDEMSTNKLFPYSNALPLIEEIQKETNSRILVLLMHWEGTAPWAPPYVWPPLGGEDMLNEFIDKLHNANNLLGVYCSGFGYTTKSNLLKDYNREKDFEEKELIRGMCAAPDGEIYISKICNAQRNGYDICPVSEVGKALLAEAYEPLLKSNIDYAQVLDQNHGGGQYFCYSRDHGHPPAPGEWMTSNMQKLLSQWNNMADKTLLGCESAAAEPFIGNLLFSDNRFELNYKIGYPVPLYSYIYHEYLRNFMGNQVSCPFRMDEDSLCYRIAYSFAAGDCMTIVLTPDGDIMSHWGMKDFSHFPDKKQVFTLIKNLTAFYKDTAKKYLYSGRMITSQKVKCSSVTFGRRDSERNVILPKIYSTAWEADDGTKAQILVNPGDNETTCCVENKEYTVPPLNAILINII